MNSKQWTVLEWVWDDKTRSYTLKKYGFRNYDYAMQKLVSQNKRGVAISALVKE